MIAFWKEHPRIGGAVAGFAVAIAAGLTVFFVRDGCANEPPPSSDRATGSDPRGEHAAGPSAAAPSSTPAAGEHAGHGSAATSSSPAAGEQGHGSAAKPATTPTTPPGFAPVALDPAQATAMGLTSEVVTEREFTQRIRTVGVVTVDETRTAHVHTRVRGWIEGFHVKYVGRKVRAGEPLVSIYSQDVYAAQLELASLMRSPVRSAELVDAARRRLALWEIPKSVIAKVEETGEPQRTFPVLAPRSGVVVAKQAFDGLFVDPSLELYTISDLSRVWVLADIYEADVGSVKVGSSAQLKIEGREDPVTAKVAFLYPTIDERTRTRKARFELGLREGTLLPGAFVTVELELGIGRGLAVPESAVIRTGARAIVFVVHGEHAEPREVKLGPLIGNVYRVDGGLATGERVATGAQFLLDSESRLRASSGMGGAHGGH
jgi:Cu(I)/Ag(I) efflux system membrane fusion protein